MEKVTTAGIDLAKRVFALHGVDGAGRVGLRKTVRREQLMQSNVRVERWGQAREARLATVRFRTRC